MKILIVTPGFWPEAFRINDVVPYLVEQGHEVDVLAGHPNYPGGQYYKGYTWWGPHQESYEGARVMRFPQVPRGKGRKWNLMLQYLSFVFLGTLRLIVAGGWSWDVILVFQSSPITAALPGLVAKNLSGARSVIWVQDLWPDVLKDAGVALPAAIGPLIGWLSRRIYRSFERVLTQNESMIPALTGVGVRRERIENIYNWADECFDSQASDVSDHESFTVMVAGNLGRVQAIPTILGAARLLKDQTAIKWILLGDGPLVPYAKERIAEWGLTGKVELPGRQPAGDMPAWYGRADAMLLSLNRGDSLAKIVPSRLQGYLASCRPVLVSGDGEAARLVKSAGAGLAAAAEDEEGLADIVLQLSRMTQQERKSMAARGRLFYEEQFSKAKCMERLGAILVDRRC